MKNQDNNHFDQFIKFKDRIGLIPIRDKVVFPNQNSLIEIGRPQSIEALEMAADYDNYLFLGFQKNRMIQNPKTTDISSIGIIGRISWKKPIINDAYQILMEGIQRAKILSFLEAEHHFEVSFETIKSASYNVEEFNFLKDKIMQYLRSYPDVLPLSINPNSIPLEADATTFLDSIVSSLSLLYTSQLLHLQEADPVKRANYLLNDLNLRVNRLKTGNQAQGLKMGFTSPSTAKSGRPQIFPGKQIPDEIKEFREKAKEKKLPEDAEKKFTKELTKLEKLPLISPESGVIRSYLELILDLPWDYSTKDKTNLKYASEILDSHHYALTEIKERILEYIAVYRLTHENKGPILCLAGPPGTGKSTLGRSIAEALDRKFIKISLGGVRDEAEIRGHRRTYVGALPGRIIQALSKCGSNNPVILLDEVDKTSADFRGDPAAALLEVLDPEQNKYFSDHYLELEFDLSRILFIATANNVHKIPAPLQDRMEILNLSGYTELEKEKIATRFLIPKHKELTGLKDFSISFSKDAIYKIIRHYTREAGVRVMEQKISKIFRRIAKEIVEQMPEEEEESIQTSSDKSNGKSKTKSKSSLQKKKYKIGVKEIEKYLDVIKFRYNVTDEKDEVGVANGLAWTEHGGDLLPIEVTRVPGKGELILTGNIGDVMKESARTAFTFVRSTSNCSLEMIKEYDYHIHVPEGAIPKDGPSAGITIATTLISLFKNIPVRSDIAMTGEITLKGKVLPIGGLKEKALAAQRAGVKEIIIPKENEKDVSRLPKEIKRLLTIHTVANIEEVFEIALIPPPENIDAGIFTSEAI